MTIADFRRISLNLSAYYTVSNHYGKGYRISQSERRRGQNHDGHQLSGVAGPAGQKGAAARRRSAGQRHLRTGLRHQPGGHLRVHRRAEARRRGDPPEPRRQEPLAAPLVDRPGGRRHRTAEDGERPPRDETHRGLGARTVRLRFHRLLPLAGLHDGQYPHGRRHGADPRAMRIPRARRAFEAAQHDPQGQVGAEPRARYRRLPAHDVHAQPPEQSGRHRSPRTLRRTGLRHNNPAQYPFG